MTEKDRKLLKKNGWTIECESPLEISQGLENRATGLAARIIVEFYKYLEQETSRKWAESRDDR